MNELTRNQELGHKPTQLYHPKPPAITKQEKIARLMEFRKLKEELQRDMDSRVKRNVDFDKILGELL